MSAGEWVRVADAMPDQGGDVLCFWPLLNEARGTAGLQGVATYTGHGWHEPEDSDDDYVEPTHWMPLPEAPK